jgi:hypothetical protein
MANQSGQAGDNASLRSRAAEAFREWEGFVDYRDNGAASDAQVEQLIARLDAVFAGRLLAELRPKPATKELFQVLVEAL